MKYFIALVVSILLHISIYFIFINNTSKKIDNKSYKNTKSNISKIQYIKLKPKVIVKNKKPIIKKTTSKTKIISKPKQKITPIKKIIYKEKKKAIKKNKLKKVLPTLSVSDFNKKEKKVDKQTKQYIDLYGDAFEKFDKQTKLFLIKNIKSIGAVTKRFLTYPMLSVQAGQDGVNVVQFMLYANGSIKNVIIDKSSGYFMLDDNTVDTIYEAYEDYPHPKKPTLIKIFVKYNLIY